MQMPQSVEPDDPYGIRARRTARGWTQRQLAERAGVRFQDVQRLEGVSAIKGAPVKSKHLKPVLAALDAPDGEPQIVKRAMPRHDMREDVPVYDMRLNAAGGMELSALAMTTAPRPDNLAGVGDAYGVQVRETTMAPMYRPRDVLIVNPNQAPVPEAGVIVMSNDRHDVVIGEFVAETPDEWAIKKYGAAPKAMTLARKQYPTCHCVAVVYPAR